jgi:tripartite-type tricarboxylate transporter receptor subunit TctC
MNDRLAMGRRGRAGALALALLVLVLGPRPAMAQQDYPNRALHVFIGFPAGSGADILGRYFAAQLEKLAGKPVVVENKPGANSNIAAGIVATAKPDGYSILFIASSNMAGSRFLFKNLPFDTVKDFTPVASYAEIAFVLTVGAKSPIKTVAELTAYLKSRKQNKYGATNQTAILSTEYYKQLAGVDAVHVAYRTAPEALPDVEDGTLDFMIMDGTFAVGPIKAGKIRALAVTTAQRIAALPDVPTMIEAGVGTFEFSPWWGVYVPAGTPQPIVAKLGAWMNQISRAEEARQFLERIAALPLSDDSKAMAARLQADIVRWEPLVKAAKIEPQ